MATLPEQPFKLSQKPLMNVYKGRRPFTPSHGDEYGFGAISGGEEDFYHDEVGNEVTDFNPKTHSVIGTLGAENVSSITGKKSYQRIRNPEGSSPLPAGFPKFGPAYSGPMANPQPYSGPMARPSGDKPLNLGSLMSGGNTVLTAPAAVTPDAVRASAAQPQQLSIADQQAADIRKSGRMTASDQTAQDLDFGNQMYNKANPNAPVGSLAAREAALARIRPNVLQGNGLYEYKTKSGGTNLASTSPDAMTPYSGQTNREVAYQKQFGAGGNWVGDNPLTGEVKIGGKNFSSQGAYEASQDTKGIKAYEDEANDFANNEIADGIRLGKLRDEQTAAFEAAKAGDLATDAARKRARTNIYNNAQLKAQQSGDMSLDYLGSAGYADPNFVHTMKGPMDDYGNPSGYGSADPSAGYRPAGTDPRYDRSMRLPLLQGDVSDGQTIDSILNGPQVKRDADVFNRRQAVIDSLRNAPQFSRGDSEPEAGGNYGNPKLIKRRRK